MTATQKATKMLSTSNHQNKEIKMNQTKSLLIHHVNTRQKPIQTKTMEWFFLFFRLKFFFKLNAKMHKNKSKNLEVKKNSRVNKWRWVRANISVNIHFGYS